MNERTLLDSVQQLRRQRFSARPFALTLVAVTLISLLAWAKSSRSDGQIHTASAFGKRDLIMQDEEVRSLQSYAHRIS